MKKSYQRPDGQTVIIEGTPEEIRRYEEMGPDAPDVDQKIDTGPKIPKKRDVMKGSGVDDDLKRLIETMKRQTEQSREKRFRQYCYICGVTNCMCPTLSDCYRGTVNFY